MTDTKESVLAHAALIYGHFGIEPTHRHVTCPFPDHDDRHPSFRRDDKGGWICTCGAGDAISFVSRMRGMKFADSLAFCASIAGTTIPDAPKLVRTPKQTSTSRYATNIWSKAARSDNAVASHPYSLKKSVSHAFGAGRALVSGSLVGQGADCIVVPIRRNGTGEVIAVQCINEEGVKQTFGQMDGAFLIVGDESDKKAAWLVVEGWASAWGIRSILRHSVAVVSFGKSRMESVAKLAADLYQPDEIMIAEDAP